MEPHFPELKNFKGSQIDQTRGVPHREKEKPIPTQILEQLKVS